MIYYLVFLQEYQIIMMKPSCCNYTKDCENSVQPGTVLRDEPGEGSRTCESGEVNRACESGEVNRTCKSGEGSRTCESGDANHEGRLLVNRDRLSKALK